MHDLAKLVDTSDGWITERTGIKERRIAAEGELTSAMGAIAARAALDDAGLAPEDIDLIILATSTPDQTFPATAVTIQAELGITHGAAFDVQAVCSGFVFALATADNYLKSGMFKRALVIGAEAFSRILDWEDRSTCVLFGDGAGAVVVEAQKLNGAMTDRGILATCLRSDGRYRDKLYVDGGPSSTGTVGHLRMDGPEVFRHAVTKISEVIGATLTRPAIKRPISTGSCRIKPISVSWTVLQGSLDSTRTASSLHVDKHANTSAASIPLGVDHGAGRWPHQNRRPGAARGHGRGLYLGRGAATLVKQKSECRAKATP